MKEGLEEFDFIYEKLQDCENQSQKEKLESDLKKEIKKLQRFREQIKNWMSGSEVKDKKPLIEHRKLIEREMERFKEVEKMMKTKAFSNEALASNVEVVDPRKKEKMATAEYIEGRIEELQLQMEAIEASIDQISSTLKKKKSDASKQAQIATLQEKLGRHKWHIGMLESILRHLENDNIEVEQINEIKEDIDYYVDSNQDPNFIEDDTFYDMLGLDDMEDSFAVIPGDDSEFPVSSSRSQSVSEDLDKEKSTSREKERDRKRDKERKTEREQEKTSEEPKDKPKDKGDDKREQAQEPQPKEKTVNLVTQLSQSQVSSPISKTGLLASTLAAAIPKSSPSATPLLKYAAVASSAAKKTSTVSTPTPISYATLASSINGTISNTNSPSTPTQKTSSISGSISSLNAQTSTPSKSVSNISQSQSGGAEHISCDTFTIPEPSVSLETINALASANASRILNNNNANHPHVNNIDEELSFLNQQTFPATMTNYLESLEIAKNRMFEFRKQEQLHVPSKKSQPPATVCELKQPVYSEISSFLETSLLNCPDSYDADKPHRYSPSNPYVSQPNFPSEPLLEIINSKKIVEKFSLDTLFCTFYYYNLRTPSRFTNFFDSTPNPDDDYFQFLAAQELHRRGWNYQAHTHTWFSKDDIVDAATAVGGVSGNQWKSFDFVDTWMVRRNAGFVYDANDVEKSYFTV